MTEEESDMDEKTKIWPDYDNSIAGIPNSIMKKFGITPPEKTLPLLDEWLTGDYKNIIVILLDGMGVNIVEENTSRDDIDTVLRNIILKSKMRRCHFGHRRSLYPAFLF